MADNPFIAGKPLRGRIVTWNLSDINVSYATLLAGLDVAGLDRKFAREICTSDAFRRAIRKLSDDRVIRKVSEDKESILFQFTREDNQGDRIDYIFETIINLDKTTGVITCHEPEIGARAQAALDAAIEQRTAADVTRIVQRIFESDADLFPIRKRGGAYFVAEEKCSICDKVADFLKAVNGELTQYNIVGDSGASNAGIKKTVSDGLSDLAAKLRLKIDTLDVSSAHDSTLQKRAMDINELRHKLDGYAAYLDEAKEKLASDIAELDVALRTKVAAIASAETTI